MEKEHLRWAFLKTSWGEGSRWRRGDGLSRLIQREVCGQRLGGTDRRGPQPLGKDLTLPLNASAASPPRPHHLPQHADPPPHLSRSRDWEMDESVYEAHHVANKTRHSAEQLAPLMGYYLCHFPPGAGAITVLDGVPSPSTPPAMFQCHAEGCALPSYAGPGGGGAGWGR